MKGKQEKDRKESGKIKKGENKNIILKNKYSET